MLILTTAALSPGNEIDLLGTWPGPHILAVLPGTDFDQNEIKTLCGRFIVVHWLEQPTGLQPVLHDAIQRLSERFRHAEGPLLCLHRPLAPQDAALDPANVQPYMISEEMDGVGVLKGLVLGEMVVTSPLLPRLFSMARARAADDKQFTRLLADAFDRSAP